MFSQSLLIDIIGRLAVNLWREIGILADRYPSTFDRRANQLARTLQAYTLAAQQAQTMAQRIHFVSLVNGHVAVLEHQLLWGQYGYNDMVRRLIAQQPFNSLEETLRFFLLPLRYCITMELKAHAAHIQHAVRLSHENSRSGLIGLARRATNGAANRAGMFSKNLQALTVILT